MTATFIGSIIIGAALAGQYVVGRSQSYDNATGWTGWRISVIRATPAWAYVAIWLFATAFLVWRHNPNF
jgi:hypothetical protein